MVVINIFSIDFLLHHSGGQCLWAFPVDSLVFLYPHVLTENWLVNWTRKYVACSMYTLLKTVNYTWTVITHMLQIIIGTSLYLKDRLWHHYAVIKMIHRMIHCNFTNPIKFSTLYPKYVTFNIIHYGSSALHEDRTLRLFITKFYCINNNNHFLSNIFRMLVIENFWTWEILSKKVSLQFF